MHEIWLVVATSTNLKCMSANWPRFRFYPSGKVMGLIPHSTSPYTKYI